MADRPGAEPAPDRGSAPRWTIGLAWLVVGALLLLHLRAWMFVCDDAFISFRYAENLARHGALVFNVEPLERVEGYTNLSWVSLLAAGIGLGIDAPDLAAAATAAASAAALGLVVALIRRLRAPAGPPTLVDFAAPLWLVSLPEFVVWASGGLETSTALALVLASMWAWVAKRPVLAAGLAALAGLTRFDALVAIAAFGLAWSGLQAGRRRRAGIALSVSRWPWRRLGIAALVFALPLAFQFVGRHEYYGEWWPNTWAVKRHGGLLRGTVGVAYLETWARSLHLWWLLVLVPLLRPRHAVLLAPIVATGAWAWSVGGDFMAYSRFLLPATALLAGLVGWLLADLDRWVSRRTGRERHVGFAAGLLLAGATATGLPGRIELDRSRPWLPVRRADPTGRWESVSAMDQFARVRLAAGRWMREHLPADVRISVGAAGALPWASGLFAIDAYGLVDPGVLEWATPDASSRARPGHQLVAPMSYVLEREPDLVCHVGHAGPRRPTPARARTFGRDFRWACIELGRIDGPRGPIDAGYYCCLRDRNTVVGPFGAEERGK